MGFASINGTVLPVEEARVSVLDNGFAFGDSVYEVLRTYGGRAFEPPIGPPGYNRLLAPDRRPYATRDGHICILVYTDRHWEAFFRIIGKPEQFRFVGAHGDSVYAYLVYPVDFDPAKKYPALAPVYGGPASGGEPSETFRLPAATVISPET